MTPILVSNFLAKHPELSIRSEQKTTALINACKPERANRRIISSNNRNASCLKTTLGVWLMGHPIHKTHHPRTWSELHAMVVQILNPSPNPNLNPSQTPNPAETLAT